MIEASGAGAEDTDNFPKAVNQSILVMLGVPYASLMVVGFFVYRGVKKNQEYRDRLASDDDALKTSFKVLD